MSHPKNKVQWCLRKAQEELSKTGKHRGLIKITPNKKEASKHIEKADLI